MRSLTEICQILNTMYVFKKLHPICEPYFLKLKELKEIKTQEDRNLVLSFVATYQFHAFPESKEIELDLIRHMQASAGQPLMQIYHIT